jgi:hypothetical protein
MCQWWHRGGAEKIAVLMLNLNTTGVTWSTLLPDHITSRTQSCYPFQNALNIGYNEKDMKDIVNTKFLGLQTDIWSMFCS